MKSESGFSFAIASQPFTDKQLIFTLDTNFLADNYPFLVLSVNGLVFPLQCKECPDDLQPRDKTRHLIRVFVSPKISNRSRHDMQVFSEVNTSDLKIELLVTSVSICLFQVLTDCFFASITSAATAANGTSPAFPNLPFGVNFHLDRLIFCPFSSQTLLCAILILHILLTTIPIYQTDISAKRGLIWHCPDTVCSSDASLCISSISEMFEL